MRALKISRKHLGFPYALFLILFVLLPLIIITYYAFTDSDGHFSLSNFASLFSDITALAAVLTSLAVAILTTVICLIIAYPVAYILARSGLKFSSTLLVLFVAPMWINFVMRMNALKEFFSLIGLLEKAPLFNTVVGMVYDFLPFMILPLYTTLSKLNSNMIEASHDLGANKITTFLKVVLPLSVPGIISGTTMVFMPSMTNYVVSEILGRGQITILGKLIENYFMHSNWNMGAALSSLLLAIMLIFTWATGGFKDEQSNARGTGLW